MVADVKNHPLQGEDAVDQPGQVVDQPVRILDEHHLLAERVKPFHVRLTLFGLQGLPAGPFRQSAHDHATERKRNHRHP